MEFKILLPTEILIETSVQKIIAEAENGYFTLLPNHIDCVTALVPGILTFFTSLTSDSDKQSIAVDGGILVKCDRQVWLSTRNAVSGKDLNSLRQTVDEEFKRLDEQQKKARCAIARLEATILRQFMALEKGL